MPRKTAAALVAAPAQESAITIPEGAREPETRMIPRALIHPDPEQPRTNAGPIYRESMRKNGQLRPLTVRPHPEIMMEWMIIDGECRWLSSEGVLDELRCEIREDMADSLAARLATQLESNTGEPLTPLEEAEAFKRIIDVTGMSVADTAGFLGRPKSTVGERLALLELGPWLPMIADGDLPLSHAVKVLLPLRTCADSVHEHAIKLLGNDYRFKKKGGGAGISLGDFENLIRQMYTPYMYPLLPSKTSYAKQPAFPTTAHGAECDCGGIMFDLGGSTPRKCCGNPSWWRPLHRKALAAKKTKGGKKTSNGTKTLYLPAATKALKTSGYGDLPKGVIKLTDSQGRWETQRGFNEESFDPAELSIDDAKLVTWPSQQGAYPYVGTTDTAAITRARAAWKERFDSAYIRALDELRAALKKHGARYKVTGAGTAHLAAWLDDASGIAVIDLAQVSGLKLPKLPENQWERKRAVLKWFVGLKEADIVPVLTGLAMLAGEKLGTPTDGVRVAKEKALEAIAKREIPWLRKPKVEAPAAAKSTGRKRPASSEKDLYPSKALAKIVGAGPLPLIDVMKKVWTYIKKQELQDKKMIGTDATMRAVFGGKHGIPVLGLVKVIEKQLAGTKEAAALIGTGKKLPLEKLSAETAELPLNDRRAPVSDDDDDGEDDWAPARGLDDEQDDLWDAAPASGDDDLAETMEPVLDSVDPLDREAHCVVCNCTDSRACAGGCRWLIEEKGGKENWGVCSRCAGSMDEARRIQMAYIHADMHAKNHVGEAAREVLDEAKAKRKAADKGARAKIPAAARASMRAAESAMAAAFEEVEA